MNKKAAKEELKQIMETNYYYNMSENRWNTLPHYCNPSENFIEVYSQKMDHSLMSFCFTFSLEFILAEKIEFDYESLATNSCITADMFNKLDHLIKFDDFLRNDNADCAFVMANKDKLNKTNIHDVNMELLTEEAIVELLPLLKETSKFYVQATFTKKILDLLNEDTNFHLLSSYAKITEEAALAYAHKIGWNDYIWINENPMFESILNKTDLVWENPNPFYNGAISKDDLIDNPATLEKVLKKNYDLSKEFILRYSDWAYFEQLVCQKNSPIDLLKKKAIEVVQIVELLKTRFMPWEEVQELIEGKDDNSIIIAIFKNQDFDYSFWKQNNTPPAHHFSAKPFGQGLMEFIQKNKNLNPSTKTAIEKTIRLQSMFNA